MSLIAQDYKDGSQAINYKKKRGHKRVNSIYTFEVDNNEVSAEIFEPGSSVFEKRKISLHNIADDSLSLENDFCGQDVSQTMKISEKIRTKNFDGSDSNNEKQIIVEPLDDDFYEENRQEFGLKFNRLRIQNENCFKI